MEAKHLSIQPAAGFEKAEITIREGEAVKPLPIKAPVKIDIKGTIGAPLEFLSKRHDQEDQINQNRCHILVDREEIQIELIIHENDDYLKGKVVGDLDYHPKFKEFGINTGKVWTPTALGLFFKMNRAFFTSRDNNMELVTALMNFTATVNNSIERSANEKGDRSDKFEQVVNSNLPKSFSLVIPIFKGMPAETLEVETFAQVNGREVSFTLLSPGAQATQEDVRDSIIDKELNAIREICPKIAIIEK